MIRTIKTQQRFYAPVEIDSTEPKENRLYWVCKMPSIGSRRKAYDITAAGDMSWLSTSAVQSHETFVETNIGILHTKAEDGSPITVIGQVGEEFEKQRIPATFSAGMTLKEYLEAFDKLPSDIANWIMECSGSALNNWSAENPT